jgi:hypothetical protein
LLERPSSSAASTSFSRGVRSTIFFGITSFSAPLTSRVPVERVFIG